MAKQRIGVIVGGLSNEREVSLNSGRHIYNIVDRARFDPIPLFLDSQARFWLLPLPLIVQNTTKDIEARLSEAQRIPYETLSTIIDVAFPITFGAYGEDGCLQGLLSLLKIPFVGSDVLAAALGQDKAMQRVLLRQNPTINIPPFVVVDRADTPQEFPFPYPVVLKPARGGSSLGVEVVYTPEDFITALKRVLSYDGRAIIEPMIHGLEFSCIVLEENDAPRALTPTETEHTQEIFTYNEKYMPGGSNKITPARVEPDVLTTIQTMCVETFRTLGFRGYARIDGFVLHEEIKNYPIGTILITDPNVYSGMSPSSWTFHQAAHENWTPTEFITKLIETVE